VLNGLLIEARNNAGDALLFVGTQLPYVAVQIVAGIVNCFYIQVCVCVLVRVRVRVRACVCVEPCEVHVLCRVPYVHTCMCAS
jgi:hypothetical protein